MDITQQLAVIKRGSIDLISEEELKKKLNENRPLRVKLGVDPTTADLHLGHRVVLEKMRAFQDLDHTAILVIGDFTASIGDPSGRDETRPVLTIGKICANAETYKKQAFKILDPSKTEIRYNSKWLAPFSGMGIDTGNALNSGQNSPLLTALSKITVSRLLEREDFKNRMKAQTPITMLEVLYPIFQGYDSVALKADVELGGSDQLFNLIVGRDMQKYEKQEPQVVLTVPLLVGTDGVKKMSKSYQNYVGLTEKPSDIFGKLMSVSDELMWKYYELLTSENLSSLKSIHPMQAKKKLAHIIVSKFHGKESADLALEEFEKVFSKKEYPEKMPVFTPQKDTKLTQVITACGLVSSMNEARRMLNQGAVKIDGEKISEDSIIDFKDGAVIQVGNRRFCQIKKTGGEVNYGRGKN